MKTETKEKNLGVAWLCSRCVFAVVDKSFWYLAPWSNIIGHPALKQYGLQSRPGIVDRRGVGGWTTADNHHGHWVELHPANVGDSNPESKKNKRR